MTAITMSRRARLATAGGAALLAATLPATTAFATTDRPESTTERISVSSAEREASMGFKFPERVALSGDGRYALFSSTSPDLVRGDTNGEDDIFLRDRKRGTTVRVSVGTGGRQANAGSSSADLSADGRHVAFETAATNLGGRVRPDSLNVYVRDVRAGVTRLATVGLGGRPANQPSFFPSLSGDGRYVAFQSAASNLVRGDTNGMEDVFVRDLRTGRTERVSLVAGRQVAGPSSQPQISDDGRVVLFMADVNRDDHGALYVRDRAKGTTRLVAAQVPGSTHHVTLTAWSLSGNGRYVTFGTEAPLVGSDTNFEYDVYRYDLRTGRTELVSLGAGGQQGNAYSDVSALSRDGRWVAFASAASNLVAGDTNGAVDTFLRDMRTGTTRRVSVSSTGAQANADSSYSLDLAIAGDGRSVAFGSFATNLVPGDRNDSPDVFVWDTRGDR